MLLAVMDRIAALLLGLPESAGLFVVGIGLVLGVIIIRRIVSRTSIAKKNEEPERNVHQA